jgi:uncharacterized membrane protein required for colicin V production
MKKIVLILIMLCSVVFAKVDYSEMSTEELLAMMGYVSAQNQKMLSKELQSRFPQMSNKEKKVYKNNLSKLKERNGK